MKILSIQLETRDQETPDQTKERLQTMLQKLSDQGESPDLIILPEIWATGFFSFDHYVDQAEPEQGSIYEMMSHWAGKFHCHIHTGSFVEKDGDRYYNTSLLLDPEGKILARYRKIHLFGYESQEKKILTPGTEIVTADTPFGRVGLATCYDLRFPEVFRAMVDQGTEIFLITSAWPRQRLDHWKLFNRVRALENQSFLISCNSCGNQKGTPMAGHSMVVDPGGHILFSGSEEEEIIRIRIDPDQVKRYRAAFPALKDRCL